MPVPTGRLTLLAAVVSFAVLALPVAAPLGLLIVNAALALIAVGDGVLAPRPARVEIRRIFPAVLPLNGEGTVGWTVANPLGRRLHVGVADELAPSLRAGTRRVQLALPPHGRVTAETTIRPSRRGRFEPGEVVVRAAGPLRLVARQGRRRLPGVLRVYPPFASRKEAELRIDRARILEIGLRSARGRGGGTEFDQLREYSVDDESRRMDWAATARTGKAIVRTYRAERNQTVIVALDNGRTMAGQVAGVARVEHAMDAVLMLTAVATRLGDRAGLVVFDRRIRAIVPPGQRADQLTRVSEAMYTLEPELAESDYRGAFTETLVRFHRRALLVLLTELADQALGDTLLPALPLILRSHLVVVASVRDPQLMRWATGPAPEPEAAYRKAAALAALEDRRLLAARLRGLGATVVDAAPGALAPALADAYLKVKATGRL
ncbi:MAG TPA: DUF58 domain-containing protein [Acidimicrobiales bacterium]|nr:DUF58 domain-containing protein [Acidimicrobiales bacterium]